MRKENSNRDYTGYFFYFIRKYKLWIKEIFSGYIGRMQARLRGIKFGKQTKFMGLACFNRYPTSEITLGDGCYLRSDTSSSLIGVNHKCIVATLRKGAKIKLGNNVGLSGTSIGAAVSIEIGNNVICGANAIITDCDWHPIDPSRRRQKGDLAKPIRIEDNVWIGMNSVVLKGVIIGKNSVIGANSIVTKEIPPNSIAGGNPCIVIKQIVSE